ncbi:leucine-zipper-like transcriptional regulator 1 [Crotalus adamanteus]|uniref:Leucine-zipper-like transcriptional regulator 1 n=1 Tax=Crotalus adamanteus TaxID=8729 RepID=A0AAW1C907_CROAD
MCHILSFWGGHPRGRRTAPSTRNVESELARFRASSQPLGGRPICFRAGPGVGGERFGPSASSAAEAEGGGDSGKRRARLSSSREDEGGGTETHKETARGWPERRASSQDRQGGNRLQRYVLRRRGWILLRAWSYCLAGLVSTWMCFPANTGMKRKTALSWNPVKQSKISPCDRYKHACCICRGFLYVYGGRRNTSLSDFWRFKIVSNEWEKLDNSNDGPEELEEHTMVDYQDILYIFGGMVDSAFTQKINPLWMYDTDRIIRLTRKRQPDAEDNMTANAHATKWIPCRLPAVEGELQVPVNRKGHSAQRHVLVWRINGTERTEGLLAVGFYSHQLVQYQEKPGTSKSGGPFCFNLGRFHASPWRRPF